MIAFHSTHATHAIRRGVDVFTLSATLGHSSTEPTSHYIVSEPGESSSLKLGCWPLLTSPQLRRQSQTDGMKRLILLLGIAASIWAGIALDRAGWRHRKQLWQLQAAATEPGLTEDVQAIGTLLAERDGLGTRGWLTSGCFAAAQALHRREP